MTQVLTVIYKNVEVGLNVTFRCADCEIHFTCGICPRFCPACGIQFLKWEDASIDKLLQPNRRWRKGEISPKPYEGIGVCGIASPPSAEEIEFLERKREG